MQYKIVLLALYLCVGIPFPGWSADYNLTPLHRAAYDNNIVRLEALLKEGADTEVQAKYDVTPLHMAANEGHKEVVQMLLNFGADPDAKDRLGRTALMIAFEKQHLDVASVLIPVTDAEEENSTEKP